MYIIEIDVSESELDPDYQHLHHAESLKLLEKARLSFLEEIGYPNSKFIEQGLFTVVAAINTKYLREVRSGSLSAGCSSIEFDGKRFVISQFLNNERGKLAITAEVECAFIDGKTRRAVVAPGEFIDAVNTYFK